MSTSGRALDMRMPGRLAYWVAVTVVFVYLGQDYFLGGNSYKQGDWLINIEHVMVRRGLPGSAFIRLSDWLHVDLLLLVVLFQAALLALFARCLFKVVCKVDDQPLFWLLLFSPAFTLLFWADDPQGSLRKELFAYAAFALLLWGMADRRGVYFAWATGLFALGMLGHEANCLFLPAFLWLLYRARSEGLLSARGLMAALMVLLGVAIVSAAFFARHVSLADAAPVCMPLLTHGLNPAFCEGAVAWVTRDLAYAIRITAGNWTIDNWAFWTIYLWITGIACWFAFHFKQRRRLLLMYICTALPFLPLFYVALDWGRWMNFHWSTWVFLVLAEQLLGHLQQDKPGDDKRLFLVLLNVLPLAPSHMTYLVMPVVPMAIVILVLLYIAITSVRGRYRKASGEGAIPEASPDAIR